MKKILIKVSCIALLGMLSINKSKAQNWDWAKNMGGSSSDQAWSVSTDQSGNVYTTGSFIGTATFGSFTLTNSGGNTDIFITKQDKAGTFLWAVKAGGTGLDEGKSISVDDVGNSYVAGYYSGTATFGSTNLTSAGAKDAFAARYDSNGNLIWANSFGGTSHDEATSIAIDGSGNHAEVRIGGYFNGTATFGSATLISSGSQDIFITAYSGGGSFYWAKNYGGTGADDIKGMTMDVSDNLYITGSFQNTMIVGTATLSSSGSNDVYVGKLNASGNGVWAKKGSGTSFDFGQAVDIDKLGNVYFSGRFSSPSLTFGASSISRLGAGYDAFLVKYDNSGNLLWANNIAYGSGDCSASGIGIDDGGEYIYVAGEFGNYATMGSIFVNSVGGRDVYISKISKLGIINSVNTAGGTSSDYANGMAINKLDLIYVAGTFNSSSANFDSSVINTAGSLDAFTASFNAAMWPVKAGGTGDESMGDMFVDTDGNSYVTGNFQGTANFGGTSISSTAYFGNVYIAKYNSSGKLMWVKKDGGTSNCNTNEGRGITVDASGNVYATGRYFGTAVFGAYNLSTSGPCDGDAFIVKYNKDGNEQWAASFSPSSGYSVEDIVSDASSNIYVTGTYSISITIGPYTLNNPVGSQATFLACFNSAGVCQWAITSNSGALGKGLATNGTNIYAVGSFTGTAGFGSYSAISSGNSDVFVAKFNMSGSCLGFVAGGSSTGLDKGNAVSLDAAGNIYITGQYSGTGIFGSQSIVSSGSGSQDVFTCKYTSALNCSWARTGGGSVDYDGGLAIKASQFGIFVTGYTISNGAFGSFSYSGLGGWFSDVFITKYSSAGAEMLVKQMGGTSYDVAYGIGVDSYGNVYCGGTFTGTGYFGSANLTSSGNRDIFIEKLNYLDGTFAREIVIADEQASEIKSSAVISPNPTNGLLLLSLESESLKDIYVYDITGKMVYENKGVTDNNINIDLSNEAQGIYIVRVTDGSSSITKKIIKQ